MSKTPRQLKLGSLLGSTIAHTVNQVAEVVVKAVEGVPLIGSPVASSVESVSTVKEVKAAVVPSQAQLTETAHFTVKDVARVLKESSFHPLMATPNTVKAVSAGVNSVTFKAPLARARVSVKARVKVSPRAKARAKVKAGPEPLIQD